MVQDINGNLYDQSKYLGLTRLDKEEESFNHNIQSNI